MNLTIDIGNTRTKTGLFHQNRLIDTWQSDALDTKLMKIIRNEYKKHPLNGILSSVKDISKSSVKEIRQVFDHFIQLDKNTPLPFQNKYESKETLGYDRIAAVAGAHKLSPDTNILVIDMGTAITFDMINAQNEFIGGNISPGIDMRFKSLYEYTARLPKLKPSQDIQLLGNTTRSAINAGILNSIRYEIKGYIEELTIKYDNLKTFLTGGSTFFFDNKLKNTIFVYPNLGLIGLNHILDYNAQKKN